MNIKFTKISASGNDFILIDNRDKVVTGSANDFFREICARRTGIGADGIVLLEKSDECDYKYRYFNDPSVYIEKGTVSLHNNFRHAFKELIKYYIKAGDMEKGREAFRFMKDKLPDWRYSEEQNKFAESEKNLRTALNIAQQFEIHSAGELKRELFLIKEDIKKLNLKRIKEQAMTQPQINLF